MAPVSHTRKAPANASRPTAVRTVSSANSATRTHLHASSICATTRTAGTVAAIQTAVCASVKKAGMLRSTVRVAIRCTTSTHRQAIVSRTAASQTSATATRRPATRPQESASVYRTGRHLALAHTISVPNATRDTYRMGTATATGIRATAWTATDTGSALLQRASRGNPKARAHAQITLTRKMTVPCAHLGTRSALMVMSALRTCATPAASSSALRQVRTDV